MVRACRGAVCGAGPRAIEHAFGARAAARHQCSAGPLEGARGGGKRAEEKDEAIVSVLDRPVLARESLAGRLHRC